MKEIDERINTIKELDIILRINVASANTGTNKLLYENIIINIKLKNPVAALRLNI